MAEESAPVADRVGVLCTSQSEALEALERFTMIPIKQQITDSRIHI
jgi:hypothetical protein